MYKTYPIPSDFINSRLDKWFKKKISEIPQSLLEKNLRKGNIKVNNKKQKSSYRLQDGDKIIVYNLNFFASKHLKKTQRYKATKKDLSKSNNLFIEDNENFAVINKPAGISVQSGTRSIKNLIDILRYTKEFEGSSPYPVHRIDKETTGLLIVAKNRKYAQLFTTLFRIRKIHKTYLSIVIGEMPNDKGTLKHELFYYEGKKKIKNIAVTHYKVINKNAKFSFLKLNPETGRKHQLRKQLLIHGYPILGDSKYGFPNDYKNNKNKIMLHAHKINFSIDNTKYNFLAEIPDFFDKFLNEKNLKNSLL